MKSLRLILGLFVAGLIGATALGQAAPPAIVRPAAVVEGWKSVVDPLEAKGKALSALKVTAPVKHGVRSVASLRTSPFVAICDDDVFGASSWKLLNLNTGGVTPGFTSKIRLEEAVLSADGQYLMGKAKAVGVQPAALVVFSMKQGKEVSRMPSGDKNYAPRPVGFAAGDGVVSATDLKFKAHLQGWDLKTGAKNWEIELPKMIEAKTIALSPGGKFFAMVTEKTLLIIETAKGETVDKVDLPEAAEKAVFGSHPMGLAFSPDGLELAGYFEHGGKGRLVIWDLATGTVMADHLGEIAKDDRWTKAERKLEYFGDPHFLRFSNHVLDRDTANVVYTIPQSKKGRNDDLVKTVGASSVLVISEKDQDKAFINVAMLPRAEIDKSLAVVRTGGKASDANLPPLTKPDYSGVRVALDAGAPATWSLKIDAPAKTAAAAAGAIALRVQRAPSGEQQATRAIAFSGAPANQIAVAYQVNDHGASRTVVDRIGLAGGIAAGSFEFPSQPELLDLSADGKFILLKTGTDRLDLYSLAAGAAKPVVAFRPYDGDKKGAAVKFGAIVSPEQVLTVSAAGRLVLWNVQGVKAVYEMTTQRDGFALSPSRTQFAFTNGAGVTLIDVASGKVLASLKGAGHSFFGGTLAFHSDGSKLALLVSQPYPRLQAFDLASGKMLADAALPKEAGAGGLWWTDESHVLVAGLLFDVNLQSVIWKYVQDPFAPRFLGSPDHRFAFVHGGFKQPSALLPVALPHAQAKQAAGQMKAEENVAVGPGTKVAIAVSVTGDAAFIKKVTEALTKHVQAAGWVVADNADVRLTATTTAKEARTMQYHVIGGNPAMQTVTIPSYECKLEINQGGQSLWQASTMAGGFSPRFTNLKKGMTVQDLVNEINANPGGGFYDAVTFPATISRPLDKIGVSKITLKGVEGEK
jgi:hypothetical protein